MVLVAVSAMQTSFPLNLGIGAIKPARSSTKTMLQMIFGIAGDVFVLQQDSAPAHRARDAVELLRRETPEFINLYSALWPCSHQQSRLKCGGLPPHLGRDAPACISSNDSRFDARLASAVYIALRALWAYLHYIYSIRPPAPRPGTPRDRRVHGLSLIHI